MFNIGSASVPLFNNASINENCTISISNLAFFSRTIIAYSKSAVVSKSRRMSVIRSETLIPSYQPKSPLRTTAPSMDTELVKALLKL